MLAPPPQINEMWCYAPYPRPQTNEIDMQCYSPTSYQWDWDAITTPPPQTSEVYMQWLHPHHKPVRLTCCDYTPTTNQWNWHAMLFPHLKPVRLTCNATPLPHQCVPPIRMQEIFMSVSGLFDLDKKAFYIILCGQNESTAKSTY